MPAAQKPAQRPPLQKVRQWPFAVRPFPFADLKPILRGAKPRPEKPGRIE